MVDKRLLVQRVGLVGITTLLLSLSGLILLPVLTKNIPVEEYGIWVQVMATLAIVPGIALLGLEGAMARYLPSLKTKEEIQEIFYSFFFMILFTSSIISMTIYLFSESIASILFENNVTIVKLLSIIIVLQCIDNFFSTYFRASQQIKKYSLISIFRITSQVALVSFFVLGGKGIIGAILGYLISLMLILSLTSVKIISQVGIKLPKFTSSREYLSFGIPTIPGNLSKWAIDSSDRYIIGMLLGSAFVGYYSPGYTLGGIIRIFFAPISFMLPMVLSISYDNGEIESVKSTISVALKYLIGLSIPSIFGLSLLSKSILTLLSTTEIALNGYWITPFVALSTLLYGFFEIVQQVIILEKRTKIIGQVWTISAVLNVVLNFMLIPVIGIVGAAITTLISFAFGLAVIWHYSAKTISIDININFVLKSLLSSLLMSLIIIVVNPTTAVGIFITVIICAFFYIFTLVIIKGINEKEITLIKTLFRNTSRN